MARRIAEQATGPAPAAPASAGRAAEGATALKQSMTAEAVNRMLQSLLDRGAERLVFTLGEQGVTTTGGLKGGAEERLAELPRAGLKIIVEVSAGEAAQDGTGQRPRTATVRVEF